VHRGLLIWIVTATLGLAGPAAALSVGVFPGSAGLDQGFGYTGCPSCSQVYALQAPSGVGGSSSITFANDLTLATETVTISLVDVTSVFEAGSESVTFSSLSYSGSVAATVLPLGGGLFLVQQLGAATGAVTGSYSATLGGSGPINLTPDLHSLQCAVDVSGTGVCGFTFGPTSFPVNDGSEDLTFQHTFNLNIPEPATWMMMVTGLLGLVFLGRGRRQG